MLNIYVNTWRNYNENGADGGEWLTLPLTDDDLKQALTEIAEAMGDHDPEWTIHDHEWLTDLDLFEVGEYDNIEQINEKLQECENLEEWELEEISAAVEAFGYSFQEAMERQQAGYFTLYRNMDLAEVAEELVNECYFTKDTPDIFTRYFDYEAFGRDLSFDGYTETKYGVIYDG